MAVAEARAVVSIWAGHAVADVGDDDRSEAGGERGEAGHGAFDGGGGWRVRQ